MIIQRLLDRCRKGSVALPLKKRWFLFFIPVVAFSLFQLGSQTTQPQLTITAIPAWGQDGNLTGYISGTGTEQTALYLFAFIPDTGWTGLPANCTPVSVQSGQFSVAATPAIIFRSATRFTAFLEPSNLSPQCGAISATIPFIFQLNALSSVTIPRLPLYSTISFGGLDWYVKTAPVPVYPGPQFFVQDNAYVDSFGQLHLKITPCGGSWCSAEVYTKQTVGYGNYSFTVSSGLTSLDPNVTLGLFSWDAQAGDQYNREWDIEFGRWGNANANANAQYVVQPYNGPNNIQPFLMSPVVPSVHSVAWSPGGISFASTNAGGFPISQWVFPGSAALVPTPGDVHLHLNFYVSAGGAPSVPVAQEVIISALRYMPAASQIGFSRVADSIPFQGQTYTAPLTATASACAAFVESDSPWLAVAGSNVVPAGASLEYSVLDDFGSTRTGNLLLQSTNCNATIGAQVLTVTQAGLVCAPTFASPSTSIGFLESVFPVFIQGLASPCTWTVSSASPWLTITSSASGAGNGSVQVSADANADSNLRNGTLSLNNGPIQIVRQDGAGNFLAVSPLTAATCGPQTAQFGLSWAAPSNVELHFDSPTGTLVGAFGPVGTTLLSAADGTVIFLIQAPAASPPVVLASAQTSVDASACNVPSIAPLGIVNAASYAANSLATNSLATMFGANLSSTTAQATGGAYPTSLGGVSVSLDGQPCPLLYVSPGQINFAVPANLVPGRYTLTAGSAASEVLITSVSPGIFTLSGDGTGVPLASVIGVLNDGTTVTLPPYQCGASGCAAVPIVLPDSLTDLYIVLYGTGIRNYKNISASLSSRPIEVVYAGAQSQYPDVDQVNLHLTAPFVFTTTQSLQLQVDGAVSNAVSLQFQ